MLGVLGSMRKLPFIFIFLIVCICFISENSDAISYKTYNLKYDIKVDIPVGWKIESKNELMQLSSLIPTREFLLRAEGVTLNKSDPPYIGILVRKEKTFYTQEKLAALSTTDFQSLRDRAIADAINHNNEYKKLLGDEGHEKDLASIRIFTERVDDVLALVKIDNTRRYGQYHRSIEYNIPMQYGEICIEIAYNLNYESVMNPIIDKVLSSIKIGKMHLQIDEIETFLNTLKE